MRCFAICPGRGLERMQAQNSRKTEIPTSTKKGEMVSASATQAKKRDAKLQMYNNSMISSRRSSFVVAVVGFGVSFFRPNRQVQFTVGLVGGKVQKVRSQKPERQAAAGWRVVQAVRPVTTELSRLVWEMPSVLPVQSREQESATSCWRGNLRRRCRKPRERQVRPVRKSCRLMGATSFFVVSAVCVSTVNQCRRT